MKKIFEVDDERIEAEVSVNSETIVASHKDAIEEMTILTRNGTTTSIRIGNTLHRVHIYREKDYLFIHFQGRSHRLKDVTEEAGRGDMAGHADLRVLAPMPGTLIKVLVAEGDRVVRGQPLAIVEAMKMENEVKAAGDAIVLHLLAVPGAKVGFGQELMKLSAIQDEGAAATA
jgi:biotin carboxyl carrier protein